MFSLKFSGLTFVMKAITYVSEMAWFIGATIPVTGHCSKVQM